MKIELLPSFAVNTFITYYLSSHSGKTRLCSNAKHAVNQASINQTDVSMTPIPITNLCEQKFLSTLLDSRFSVLIKLEDEINENLQLAQALRQSILKKAFAGQLVPQDPNDEPAAALLARIRGN
jgi:type I restriction enzyme S subunit